jgi:hypothetical protein
MGKRIPPGQSSLFDDGPYGGFPPHVDQSTSISAAAEIAPHAAKLRLAVYQQIICCGQFGATDDEIEVALKLRHQTVSARRRELVLLSQVTDSGRRRKTRSGRSAIVWFTRNGESE